MLHSGAETVPSEDNLRDIPILVVDDSPTNLEALRMWLNRGGYHNIITARNGLDALEKIEKTVPSLIILDLLMPVMDGFEFCEKLKEKPKLPKIPIIIQTASNERKHIRQAFELGAYDFINKPIYPEELLARVKVHLSRQRLLSELEEFRTNMQEELNSASLMQNTLLPSQVYLKKLESQYNLKLASFFQASSDMGGDIWGAVALNKYKVLLYIGDFSGHGIKAALNTVYLHSFMNSIEGALTAEEYLSRLNRQLCRFLPTEEFGTMFCAILDTEANQLNYAASATPNPYILHGRDKTIERLDGSGSLLGVDENTTYQSHTASFETGDTLLLFSDALIETRGQQTRMTEEKVEAEIYKIMDTDTMTPDSLIHALKQLVYTHAGRNRLEDDLTICACMRIE